jgi:hypothetical protein
MATFPADVWHAIAAHLGARDLCRLMQCSRDFFHLFVSQRAWAPQEARLYTDQAMREALEPIFERHRDDATNAASEQKSGRSIKSNSNKKRKTAWITPRKGTWYVFKRFISKSFTMEGLKELCRKPELCSLAVAVALSSLPHRELITSTSVERETNLDSTIMYCVTICYNTGYNMEFQICRAQDDPSWRMFGRRDGFYYDLDGCVSNRHYFDSWRYFVLRRYRLSCWTSLFGNHVGDVK